MLVLPIKKKWFDMILSGEKNTYENFDLSSASIDVQNIATVLKDGTLDIIKEQPKISEWIPCGEKLPEDDGFYLAAIDGEIAGEDKPFTGLAEFEKGRWIDDEEDYQCIIAWMPLPEPYKEPVPRYKSNFMSRFEKVD